MLKTIFIAFGVLTCFMAIAFAGGPAKCDPDHCGTFTPCSPEPCFCFEVAEGGGLCLGDFFCDTHQNCTSSDDCPDGRPCLVNHCCGVGKCGPLQCQAGIEGAVEGVSFGLTATGQEQ